MSGTLVSARIMIREEGCYLDAGEPKSVHQRTRELSCSFLISWSWGPGEQERVSSPIPANITMDVDTVVRMGVAKV